MSEDSDYALKQRRKAVLAADRWRCMLCDSEINPKEGSIDTDDEKDSVLRAHINETHLGSPMLNTSIKDEYMVCYFKPIVEVLQGNTKTQ
jgi:hypothetical protein